MRKSLIALSVLLILNLACVSGPSTNESASPGNRNSTANTNAGTAASPVSDKSLAAKTKLELLADERTSGFVIEVTAEGRAVTLTGRVDTETARAAAEEVAASVEGVQGVNNQLQVASDAARNQTTISEEQLEASLQKLMNTDERLGSMTLSSKIENSTVTISGSAENYDDLLYAAEAIRRIPGVTSVNAKPVEVPE
jgi:osmotically-inducible protein OsmY